MRHSKPNTLSLTHWHSWSEYIQNENIIRTHSTHTHIHTKHTIILKKRKAKTEPKNKQTINYLYNLGSWSASTSPARSPSPLRYAHGGHHRGKPNQFLPMYGTTSLCQRSRSPSPARLQEMRERGRLANDFG